MTPRPSNIIYHPISKEDIERRVNTRLALDQPWQLPAAYKLCDLKPLFGHLFPEAVLGYEWWGYTDTDILLGNMLHFFTRCGLARVRCTVACI